MTPVTPSGADEKRRRRRSATEIKDSLRAMNIQVSLLNHHVGARLALRDADLYCLDLINREGPMSPTAVARRAGLHPATITGILDRLERGAWIARERDTVDRRAVVVRAARERNRDLYELLSGMNTAMDGIIADYAPAELDLLADFLRRTTEAGRQATDDLVAD